MKTIVKVVVGVLLVVTLYTAWQVVADAQPKYGLILIATNPAGVDVYCDGIYEGTTGTSEIVCVDGLIVGNTVSITVKKSGYHTAERRIRITLDPHRTVVDITLQKKQFWE